MSKSVTIDQIGATRSVEWGEADLGPSLPLHEAPSISSATEIIYTKQTRDAFDQLFPLSKRNQSWALFSPPPGYTFQTLRFFRMALIPELNIKAIDDLFGEDPKIVLSHLPKNEVANAKSSLNSLKKTYQELSSILLEIIMRSKIVKG